MDLENYPETHIPKCQSVLISQRWEGLSPLTLHTTVNFNILLFCTIYDFLNVKDILTLRNKLIIND